MGKKHFSIPKYTALLNKLQKEKNPEKCKNVWGGKSMRRKNL